MSRVYASYLGMRLATLVSNPTRRAGESGYVQCCHCKLHFTKLGVARHWGKCPSNPKRQNHV